MAGIRVEGNTSGNVAEVDNLNNLQVTLPQDPTYSGFTGLAGELGATGSPAGRLAVKGKITPTGRVAVAEVLPYFNDTTFNSTAINTANYFQAAATMTITQAAGTMNLNAGASVTASTYALVRTYQHFPLYYDYTIIGESEVIHSIAPQINCTTEIGFINATTNTAAIDGAFFRYDATGTLKAVLNNNGTEFTSAALTAPAFAVANNYRVVISSDKIYYYINDVLQATLVPPTGLGYSFYGQSIPYMWRTINGGTAPASASTIKIASVFVSIKDGIGLAKPVGDIMSSMGKIGSQGQQGQTMGTTALYSNSLAAGAGAAMTNTTAALGSGLGGQFAALPTLTAGTDGIICSFQNPTPTAAIPGKMLYIRGVKVHGAVTTVLAGGPVLYAYSLAYGHTAVSLATTEGAGTKAPRRIALGYETFAATAAVGVMGSQGGVYVPFSVPVPVCPGEFIAVVAKNLGTVTTTGVITFQVTFDSYWE